jgi:hypothetical protein
MVYEGHKADDQGAAGRGPGGPAPGAGVAARLPPQFSRKGYTRRRPFALLALKASFEADYRGLAELLRDFPALRGGLGLSAVPRHSTLRYAAGRPLKKGGSSSPSTAPPRAPGAAA